MRVQQSNIFSIYTYHNIPIPIFSKILQWENLIGSFCVRAKAVHASQISMDHRTAIILVLDWYISYCDYDLVLNIFRVTAIFQLRIIHHLNNVFAFSWRSIDINFNLSNSVSTSQRFDRKKEHTIVYLLVFFFYCIRFLKLFYWLTFKPMIMDVSFSSSNNIDTPLNRYNHRIEWTILISRLAQRYV